MAGENTAKIKIDGAVYEVDFDDLELDEVGMIEDLTGRSVANIDWESARGMQGLACIALRRNNPSFTWEQAGKLKFSSFEPVEDPAEKPKRPTKAAPAAKPGANS
jgi:hypothetical protein